MGRTDFDAELIEFTLDVPGDILFKLLATLEEFLHGHLCDQDTAMGLAGDT